MSDVPLHLLFICIVVVNSVLVNHKIFGLRKRICQILQKIM